MKFKLGEYRKRQYISVYKFPFLFGGGGGGSGWGLACENDFFFGEGLVRKSFLGGT